MDRSIEYNLEPADVEWLLEFNKVNPQHSMAPFEMELIVDRLEKESYYHLNTNRITLQSAASRKRRRFSAPASLNKMLKSELAKDTSSIPKYTNPTDDAGAMDEVGDQSQSSVPADSHPGAAGAAATLGTAAQASTENPETPDLSVSPTTATVDDGDALPPADASASPLTTASDSLDASASFTDSQAGGTPDVPGGMAGSVPGGSPGPDPVNPDQAPDAMQVFADQLPGDMCVVHMPVEGANPLQVAAAAPVIGQAQCASDLLESVAPARIAQRCKMSVKCVDHVIIYWLKLRRQRKWRPLINRFCVPTVKEWIMIQNPTVKQQHEMSLVMRRKFEKLRILLDMVRRREEAKRQLVINQIDSFQEELNSAGVGLQLAPVGSASADRSNTSSSSYAGSSFAAYSGATESASRLATVPECNGGDSPIDADASDAGAAANTDDAPTRDLHQRLRVRLSAAIQSKNEQELCAILDELRSSGLTELPLEVLPKGFTLESFEKRVKEDAAAGSTGASGFSSFINRIAVFCGVKKEG